MSAILAIDCDLHRIHAVCSKCGVVCRDQPDPMRALDHVQTHVEPIYGKPFILFEIASPQSYRDGKAAHHQLAKWMIFNASIAAWIFHEWPHLFVSPSSKWTKGYEAKVRQKMADAKAPTHDLREAESMIFFYNLAPDMWTTYKDYLYAL